MRQAIYDEEVSCQIPTQASPESTINVPLFTYIIQHAQIASQICRRLGSVGSFHKPQNHLWTMAKELEGQLNAWKESLPAELQPKTTFQASKMVRNTSSLAALSLQLGYYGSVLALYTPFMNPWISKALGENVAMTAEQYTTAMDTVANAARNLIFLSTQVEVNAASPQWLVFPLGLEREL